MLRILLAAALLLPVSNFAQANEPVPAPPVLRAHVTVTGELVRVGDLVDNAGANADVAIFRAPDLGETGKLPTARVIEALRPHHIFALDTRGISEVSVTRASRQYATKDFEAMIAQAIAAQTRLRDAKNISISFDRIPQPMLLDPDATHEPRLTRLSFDQRSGRFDIAFELPGEARRRQPLRFSGVAVETFEAAVVTRPIARGEILRHSDLTLERRSKAEVSGDAVSDPRLAIGQAARMPLRAGQVVRQNDLAKPEMVQRNEMVLIVYDAPGVSLTLRGKALETGSLGDVVSVMNLDSKRTLQGTVSGRGQITIAAPLPRLAASLPASAASGSNQMPLSQE